MIAAALVLVLAQDADLEKRIDRLVERFREDDIVERDAAGRELETLGPAALPSLARRAERAEPEIKARLLGAAREIERRARVAPYLGRPSRLTLKAEARPLRDVLAELGRLTPYEFEARDADLDRAVTVDLRDASFFEAIDRVCRAQGAAVPLFDEQSLGYTLEATKVTIAKGDPAALRRRIEGGLLITLAGVECDSSGEIGGEREDQAYLRFAVHSEPGARPMRAGLEATRVLDGDGNPLEIEPDEDRGDDALSTYLQGAFQLPFKKPLPDSVRSLREVSGKLTLEFPGDFHSASVAQPVGKRDVETTGPAGFLMKSCTRSGNTLTVVYVSEYNGRSALVEPIRHFFVDARGREAQVGRRTGSGTGGGKMTWTATAELPAGFEPAEFRVLRWDPDKHRRVSKTVEFTFKDVRFR